ncbi:MAG: hypothetical protein ACXIVE_17765, partial [Salinarimonas sp.]
GFQVQSFPFRMTPENLAQKRYDQHIAFWRNLKEGHHHFEVTQRPPRVDVCNREYSFNTQDCRPIDNRVAQEVAERQRRDEVRIAQLIERGKPAVRIVYQDGGSHPSFTNQAVAFASATDPSQLSSRARRLGEVSRPDAIAAGPQRIRVGSNGQPIEAAQTRAMASAPAQSTPQNGVSSVARSEAAAPVAGEERPLHQRLFGNLFSRGMFSGGTSAPQAPATEAVPTPPQRGAGLLPGAQPLTPRNDAHYTSFR